MSCLNSFKHILLLCLVHSITIRGWPLHKSTSQGIYFSQKCMFPLKNICTMNVHSSPLLLATSLLPVRPGETDAVYSCWNKAVDQEPIHTGE